MNKNTPDIDNKLEEISQNYTELTYLQRLKLMWIGLSYPNISKEYKSARIEVQRLAAPLLAILLPLVFILVLAILSMTTDIPEKIFPVIYVDKVEKTPDLEKLPDKDIKKQDDPIVDMPPIDVQAPEDPTPNNIKDVPQPPLKNTTAPNLSPFVIKNIGGPGPIRKKKDRDKLITVYDPTQVKEKSIMRTLRWLKKNQQPDGSWKNNSIAMTSLAILTFLAHAETPGESKEFGTTVQKGLEYLLSQQTEEGRFKGSDGHEYSLPIAAYTLCEAYGMTRNPNVKSAGEKSLALIIKGQHDSGGWDYNLKQTERNDTSYMGWCLQALKAGHISKMEVNGLTNALKLAVHGFKSNAGPSGGFGYTTPSSNHGLTSVGTLCLQLLGNAESKEVKKSMEIINTWVPSLEEKVDGIGGQSIQYYFYYAAQCRFHSNKKSWDIWDDGMKKIYIPAQKILSEKDSGYIDHEGKAQEIGWWENKDHHSDRPVMDTCLVALQLMVYYRNLPITKVEAIQELAPTSIEKDDIIVSSISI